MLAFHYLSFEGDAGARTANAYYVLFSRDPHLGAIGFVWNPLPSMSVMPLLLLSHIWRPLTERAFAANIMSAVFMAGAVAQLRGICSDCGVRRSIAFVITVLFALNPMTVYYGGNGMSEALFLLTLMTATRHLMRHLATGEAGPLVNAGVWLGIAYYARNEAIVGAGFAGLVVLGSSYLRASGERRIRVRAAVVDGMILGLPPLFAFVTWAAASWVIVGHPFEQFTSQYGNTAQLQAMQSVGFKTNGSAAFAIKMALLMAPTAVVAAMVAMVRARRTRDLRFMAPLAVLGGALVFAVLGFAARQTSGWFRYFITGVPLTAVLAALCFADSERATAGARPVLSRAMGSTVLALIAATALSGPSFVTVPAAIADPSIGREESKPLAFILQPRNADLIAQEQGIYLRSTALARHLDGLKLPDSSVIVGTFGLCSPFIVMASRHPKQFIITNDRDFKPILADPVAFKARYLLVPEPKGVDQLDSINAAYPDMYATGSQIATQVDQFSGPGCPTFRLYAVN